MTRENTTREEVVEALATFDTGMLITLTPEGVLRGRPMQVARRDEDGTVWFVTGAHSGKVEEVALFDRAAAVFQAPRLHVHISGAAEIVDDRSALRDMWRERWRLWFPNGPDDESLTLLRLTPKSADLWDTRGLGAVRYAVDAVRSFLGRGSAEAHLARSHRHTAM